MAATGDQVRLRRAYEGVPAGTVLTRGEDGVYTDDEGRLRIAQAFVDQNTKKEPAHMPRKMNPKWDAIANANGGVFRSQTEAFHEEMGKHHTPEARKSAAIDLGCVMLQAMKGLSVAEIKKALVAFVDKFDDVMPDAIEHGTE